MQSPPSHTSFSSKIRRCCVDRLNPPHKADIPRLSSDVRFYPQKRTFIAAIGMSVKCQKRTSDLVHLCPTPPMPAQWCRRRKSSRCVAPRAQLFLKLPVRRSDRVRLTKRVWLRFKAGPESTPSPWVWWPQQGAIFYRAIPNRAWAARITDVEAPLIDVR